MTLEELKQMQEKLTEYDYCYYILSKPVISDYNYDMLDKAFDAAVEKYIGKHTRSNEYADDYPQWVIDKCGKGV